MFEWGSFRVAFKEVKKIKEYFPSVPLHLHTATMTKQMQDESITKILKNPVVLKSTSNCPNIYYRVLSYSPPSTITNPNGNKVENWQKKKPR